MADEETVVEEIAPLSGRDAGETYLTPAAPASVMPEAAPCAAACANGGSSYFFYSSGWCWA